MELEVQAAAQRSRNLGFPFHKVFDASGFQSHTLSSESFFLSNGLKLYGGVCFSGFLYLFCVIE